LENHHPAGRANNARITVAICRRCHDTLTRWQFASGIELAHDAPRDEISRNVALLIGAAHVFGLAAHHSQHDWPAGRTLLLLSRALGYWTGRALPSSLVPAPFPKPSRLPRTTAADSALAELLAGVARELDDEHVSDALDQLPRLGAELGDFGRKVIARSQEINELIFRQEPIDADISVAYRETVTLLLDRKAE